MALTLPRLLVLALLLSGPAALLRAQETGDPSEVGGTGAVLQRLRSWAESNPRLAAMLRSRLTGASSRDHAPEGGSGAPEEEEVLVWGEGDQPPPEPSPVEIGEEPGAATSPGGSGALDLGAVDGGPLDQVRAGFQAWLARHEDEIATIQGLTDTSTEEELIEVLRLRQRLLQETAAPVLEEVNARGNQLDGVLHGLQETWQGVRDWIPPMPWQQEDEGVEIGVEE